MSFRSLLLSRRAASAALAPLVLAGLTSAASAHVGTHVDGLAAGFAHPFSGLDHLLAMVAVGIWAAQLGRSAQFALPVLFPLVMAVGAVMGANAVALPGVELGVAASVVALGVLVAFSLKPSLVVSAALVAAFALLHGHSHGTELPQAMSGLAYGAGFIAATVVLHAAGLALGTVLRSPAALMATRTAGAGIAAAGAILVVIA
jgi:urease accessory protein